MLKLYTSSWDVDCQQAERLLRKAGVAYKVINVTGSRPVTLPPGFEDASLPLLVDESHSYIFYEGLKDIMELVKG
jgi:hypothetical protein